MRDGDGFDEFYQGTSRRLLRYALAVIGEPDAARDAVQEAYARAWREWPQVSAQPNPEGWLRVVVSRLARDRASRLRRWSAIRPRSRPEPSTRPPSEDTRLLVAALSRMPLDQRQAVALRYLFDMSPADIAVETGAAPGTVTSWLSRGRAGLLDVLGAAEGHGGVR